MRTAHRFLGVAIVAVLVASVGSPARAAAADVRIPMGGGAGIVINGDTMCTLTTIGGDSAGDLIGLTSAHCGGPGATVAAEGAENAGILGTMVSGNDNLDYAVIKFDPAKVTPEANFNGFLINGIGPDPAFGEIACKQGRTTGNSCGVTWGPGQDPGTIVMQVCGQPGDSGAPVTVNNQLVGMIHGAFSDNLPTCVIKYIPLHTPAVVMSINADLADINAKHRPGSGFSPLPG
ncbi:MAG: serine protease [Mycobacterium sp.]|uniref:S1 family peptidase n=1 Tax=Mycobacterium sp. TaxID=1785 RepID=UPI001ED0255D|nr:S1 family peptidase [Mycobacterium sp.]MBV8786203.1 serine protease [Mycobacterium sp.]